MTPEQAKHPFSRAPPPLPRPRGQFIHMPHRWRWEATRRHPYYVLMKKRAEWASQFDRDGLIHRTRPIGVNCDAYNPVAEATLAGENAMEALLLRRSVSSTSALKLPKLYRRADQMSPSVFAGEGDTGGYATATPLLHDLLLELLDRLPPGELEVIGRHIIDEKVGKGDHEDVGGDSRDGGSLNRPPDRTAEPAGRDDRPVPIGFNRDVKSYFEFSRRALYPRFGDHSDLMREADPSFMKINPYATQKDVVDDVKVRLKRLQEGVEKARRKFDDKILEEQLRVWDLREGWGYDGYDLNARHTPEETMTVVGCDTSTENDRYQAAFALVTGYAYSRETWWEAFARYRALLIVDEVERDAFTSSAIERAGRSPRGASARQYSVILRDTGGGADGPGESDESVARGEEPPGAVPV